MTPQTALQAAAVLQAFAEGKAIQSRPASTNDEWEDCPTPWFNFPRVEYRVKPEPPKPREWLIVDYPDGIMDAHPAGTVFTLRPGQTARDVIRVREVLDAPEPPTSEAAGLPNLYAGTKWEPVAGPTPETPVRPLRKPPEGIADPPDGWEYFGNGPADATHGASRDISAWHDRGGWRLGGWVGNDPAIHYALRIGSAVHAENFNKEKV